MATRIAYVITMICSALVQGQTTVDFIHYEHLDGKRCTTPLFTVVARSLISCAVRCSMDVSCKSHFYISETNMCIGCDSIYENSYLATLTNEADTLYYRPYALYNEKCSTSDKPCIEDYNVCFSELDTCVCDPFYVYNPTTKSCESGCTDYGSTYQMYPNYVHNGFDELQYDHVDPAICLSRCTDYGWFTCYGVDYNHIENVCSFNNGKPTTTSWLKAENEYNTYIRNCA